MPAHCILVVDDDHDVRVSLRDVLELEGYCVCSAANGQSALDLMISGQCTPSLILLDLMMPVMSGWDFLTAIEGEAAYRDIPVVVTSAARNQSSIAPNREFAAKPLDLRGLKDTVAKYLKSA